MLEKNNDYDYFSKRESWESILGWFKLDDIKPTPFYLDLVEQEIKGEITTAEMREKMIAEAKKGSEN